MAADAAVEWGPLQWVKDPPAAEWDRALADLGGHPLQSCLWGDARRSIDGIVQHRWLARRGGEPVWMIRVEERGVLGGKIAWAPRGPTGRTADLSLSVPPVIKGSLKAQGFALLICDPWVDIGNRPTRRLNNGSHLQPQTIWIDLSVGRDTLFKNLHKRVRNDVRRAAKADVSIAATREPERIAEFAKLCASISARKGFELRVTPPLLSALLHASADSQDAETALLVSLKDGRIGAGLFIMRVGRSVHMISAGTNRDLRHDRVGEACQWGAMEWALARGCTRYDLGGIDPINNPSVYEFKKRFGGQAITLCGHVHRPLTLSGRAMSWLIRCGTFG